MTVLGTGALVLGSLAVALAAAAGTLYAALLGLGVWIVGAPPPFGPSWPLFVAGCLLLSAALASIWLRELASDG